MLDLGKFNLFLIDEDTNTTDKISGGFCVSKLLNYYDDMGKNCIYLDMSRNISVNCKSFSYARNHQLLTILKENLFRVDIIIIDLSVEFLKDYKAVLSDIREFTDLPIILVSDKLKDFYGNYENIFDYIYSLYRLRNRFNFNGFSDDDILYVRDIKNDWISKISDLKTQLIREEKINNILKK
jgi:hypothetical protein